MAEESSSRARVTITLGRSGQVVERTSTSSSAAADIYLSDFPHSTASNTIGAKRSVRDRLGTTASPHFDNNCFASKRRRGDVSSSTAFNSSTSNPVQDIRLGKDDLRFKLLQKKASTRIARTTGDDYGKTVDLRDKLTKVKAAMRHPSPPPRSTINTRPPPQPLPGTRDASMFGRIPSARSADDLPRMDYHRGSYYPPEREERVTGTSKGLSPPRNMRQVPLHRTYDDVRPISYLNGDVLSTPRSVNATSSSFMTKPAFPNLPGKPLAAPPPPPPPPQGQLLPSSSNMQRSSLLSEEHQTVEGLLHSLGLGKYTIFFKAEEVDMAALMQMGETDLKEMGIPMGPRKKLLLALQSRLKRHP